MNARHLIFASAALLVVAACTIKSNDNETPDGGTSSSGGTSSGTSGTAGDGSTAVSEGGMDAGADADITIRSRDGGDASSCLGSFEQGPLCHKDETPEVPAKCANECDTASTAFVSDVAYGISACIDDSLTADGLDATPDNCEAAAGPCVAAATAESCGTAADVDTYCNGIVTTCPDKGTPNKITKDECVQYMRGATTAGKQLLLDCLDDEKSDPNVCKICMDAIKTVHDGD